MLGVGEVHILALALNIGAEIAADVGTLVVLESRELERVVNEVDRALNKALTVGVLNAQNELSALRLSHKVLVQSGSEVADVHKARRARRVTCSDGFLCHKITLFRINSIPNNYSTVAGIFQSFT